jgi:hypothetical protein
MKVLFKRSTLYSPTRVVTRKYSALQQHAVRILSNQLKEDLEHNPHLWLSASAVVSFLRKRDRKKKKKN